MAKVSKKKEPELSKFNRVQADSSVDSNVMQDKADPREVAEYLASLLDGAREMAGKSGMIFLAYLIQVAVEEARIQSAAPKDPIY